MSKCVVRMETPKCCLDCPCVNGEYGYCQADKEERQIEDPNGRPSWCPIICSLPEGHGRLVDMRDIEQMEVSASDKQDEYFVGWNDAIKICQTATTIVPAEAERSET